VTPGRTGGRGEAPTARPARPDVVPSVAVGLLALHGRLAAALAAASDDDAPWGPAALVALAAFALLAWTGYDLLHPVLADGS